MVKTQEIHLFGEMDLDIHLTQTEIFDEAFRISEACGYMISEISNILTLQSLDEDTAKIHFENNKVSRINVNGKELNFEKE